VGAGGAAGRLILHVYVNTHTHTHTHTHIYIYIYILFTPLLKKDDNTGPQFINKAAAVPGRFNETHVAPSAKTVADTLALAHAGSPYTVIWPFPSDRHWAMYLSSETHSLCNVTCTPGMLILFIKCDVHTHSHTHTYNTYIHTYIHTYIQIHIHTNTHIHTLTHRYTCR
jgi:hypothetical protein